MDNLTFIHKKNNYQSIKKRFFYFALNKDTQSTAKEFLSLQFPIDDFGLKKYLEYLLKKKQAPSTIKSKIYRIRSLLFSLIEQAPQLHLKDKNKLKEKLLLVRPPTPPPSIISTKNTLSIDEIDILISRATPKTAQIIQFLFYTGVRVSEMTHIRLFDCHIEGGITYIHLHPNTHKKRIIKLPFLFFKKLNKGHYWLFETKNKTPLSRIYISSEIKKLGKQHLQRSISPHTLRHSFALNQIQKHGKIKALSQYLGHSSSSITHKMYLSHSLSMSDLSP